GLAFPPVASIVNFRGPTIGVAEISTSTLSGGPNNGVVYDFAFSTGQLLGDPYYTSISNCGLTDTYPLTASFAYYDVFNCGAYLWRAPQGVGSRAAAVIDGSSAYASYSAESLFAGSANNPGLPALTWSGTVDTTTGNAGLSDVESWVKCAPAPGTFPAT